MLIFRFVSLVHLNGQKTICTSILNEIIYAACIVCVVYKVSSSDMLSWLDNTFSSIDDDDNDKPVMQWIWIHIGADADTVQHILCVQHLIETIFWVGFSASTQHRLVNSVCHWLDSTNAISLHHLLSTFYHLLYFLSFISIEWMTLALAYTCTYMCALIVCICARS